MTDRGEFERVTESAGRITHSVQCKPDAAQPSACAAVTAPPTETESTIPLDRGEVENPEKDITLTVKQAIDEKDQMAEIVNIVDAPQAIGSQSATAPGSPKVWVPSPTVVEGGQVFSTITELAAKSVYERIQRTETRWRALVALGITVLGFLGYTSLV